MIALLDDLGAERVAVVGASYGGKVAAEQAALFPDRAVALGALPSAARGKPGADLLAFRDQEEALIAESDIAGAVEQNVRTWLGPEAAATSRDAVRAMQRHTFEVQFGR